MTALGAKPNAAVAALPETRGIARQAAQHRAAHGATPARRGWR